MKKKLFVGVFRKGILLFPLLRKRPMTMAESYFWVNLLESFNLPLEEGDYIAADFLEEKEAVSETSYRAV